jgi:hypothetical protein
MSSQAIYTGSKGTCVFVANEAPTVASISALAYNGSTLKLVGAYEATAQYDGTYGVGIAVSGNYLYAEYIDNGEIEVWQIGSGCQLTDTGHSSPSNGLCTSAGYGGGAMGITPNGEVLIVGYRDGSVGSVHHRRREHLGAQPVRPRREQEGV